MATISLNDVIFATLSLRGKICASIRTDGVTSYAEILSLLLRKSGISRGLATVDLRNSSQGWTARRSVMIAGA
ncbi:MAG: hypothetical protein K2L46_07345 [Paramuribaculum sp.]|nr:hypothetical protein [Paramuribaculum sp.]MDE6324069.1 hypothetical protein [Paramuribaculum sp.]MDE6489079.1 hypothetical protein [Paramuribaculum sp.]